MSEASHFAPSPEGAVQIRARPPSPKRLSRKVLLTGALGIGGIVAFALLSGLAERPDRRAGRAEDAPAASPSLPESLRLLPTRYTSVGREESASNDGERDMLWGERGPPEGWENPYRGGDLEAPREELWSGEQAGAAEPTRTAPASRSAAEEGANSPILFDVRGSRRTLAAAGVASAAQETADGSEGRARFTSGQRESEDVLDASYVAPRSAFAIHAGAVIPAALVTGLNSDLPGRVIAQVTAPVYDSVTGDHLLIPQGARLLGTYDSAAKHGDGRLFLVWNRLVMPNGWSIALGAMVATDPEGAAGLRDRTDNHWGRVATAVGLSAVLSIVANEAEGDDRDQGFRQSIGDAAAQEAARVGGRMIDRELNVPPTLRVRPGAPVRVLVTSTIELKPYAETEP